MSGTYGLDEAGLRLSQGAATLAREVAGPAAARVDAEARFPAEGISALAEAGYLGLIVPPALGGQGSAPRVFAAVVEEIAQHCASTAMVFVMHTSATAAIAASSLPDKDDLLREIAAGRHLSTLAFSEKGSRSLFWMPASELVPSGDGYTTSAAKSWVTSAGRADSYVSSARSPGAETALASTLYLVRKGASGVRKAKGFDGLGLRGNDSAPVDLDQHPVAAGDLMTPHGKGLEAMLTAVVPWFGVGTAAMGNGLCRAALAATIGHLSSVGFDANPGAPRLRDLQVLRARVTQMSVKTEQSRALLGYTVGDMEHPGPMTALYVLQSRLAAINAALEVTDLAMKACGGAAFSKHLPIERLFRDARAGWVMAPTSDHIEELVGRALTGLPLF